MVTGEERDDLRLAATAQGFLMNEREALIHIRTLIKVREREGSSGSTKAKVAAAQWDLMSEERYKVQLHDQIRLTLTEGGWAPFIATEDGNFVGRAATSANLFKTPEEALADLRKQHHI